MRSNRTVRIRFSKLGKLRWISHRDAARLWERTLRRAGVPVAYSEGFSPHPKLSFGLALPTGAESSAEYMDIEVQPDTEAQIAPESAPHPEVGLGPLLNPLLPEGLSVLGEADVEPGGPSLQEAVVASTWEITVPDSPEEDVERLLAADSVVITRERKGQSLQDDIRPAVLGLSAHTGGQDRPGHLIRCDLATKPRGLRPSELLAALGIDPFEARVLRTHQWIERDGAWHEPVPVPDAPVRAEARLIRRDPVLDGTRNGGGYPRRGAGPAGAVNSDIAERRGSGPVGLDIGA